MNCGIISKQHGGDDAAADADIYVRYLFMHQICYSQISVIIVLIMEIKFYPSMFEMISICIGKCACLSYNQENRSYQLLLSLKRRNPPRYNSQV